MIKHLIVFCIFSSLFNQVFSQLSFDFNDEIIVKKGSDTLHNAWAGGLDYVQISDFDFDFDGDMDLFVFDRSRDNIRVFTQEIVGGSPKWKIMHNAYLQFPEDLIYRATMIDFDSDGRKDIFTYGIGGLKVYRNTGNLANGIQWTLFKEIVNSDYNGFVSNLYVASSDIPAIADIDFDGDVDVLTFHQGGQHVEYHKNMSMENFGIPDSLEFVLMNECWGKFSENLNNNSVTLNAQESPCNGDGILPNPQKDYKPKHAGSTLLAMDIDNSGVMDLIIGDVAYNNLGLLINGGTEPNQDSPMISIDNSFPSNSLPVDLYLFPGAYWVDVDFDSKKDLVVGANAKNVSENETSIYFYKNTGTNVLPNFNYQTKSFLQNSMMEHGKGSVPVIFDYNNDGLKDLLVANLFRFKTSTEKESTIALYRNTGTSSVPKLTFVDYDYLNLSQQNFGLRLIPTFGDLDGDGLSEMILGNEFGSLIFFENNGTTFANPQQNYPDDHGAPISVGSFSFPQLFDLNKDGLLDLVIGNKTGKVAYYTNIGTINTPIFQLVTDNLGGIDVSTSGPDGYSTPHFFMLNDTTHLFVGNLDGKIYRYNNIDDSLLTNGSFQLVTNNFLNLSFEGYSSMFVDDIDGDSFLNMFVGQDLGGITSLEVDPNSTINLNKVEKLEVLIHPNPTNGIIRVKMFNNEKTQIRMFDLNGKTYHSEAFYNEITIDLQDIDQGIYLIELITTSGQSVVKKIVRQ